MKLFSNRHPHRLLSTACLAGVLLSGCSNGNFNAGPAASVTAPAFSTQPLSQSVFVGDTVTFTAVTTGTSPQNFEWRRNGIPAGAPNTNTYTTPPLTLADNGAAYTLAASNAAGIATSAPAVVTVAAHAVQITSQPMDVTILAGKPATFSVTASGTPALNYQWFRGSSAIPGATGSSYVLASPLSADSLSTFYAVVTNPAGSVTSSTARLTVNPAVTFTQTSATQWDMSNGLISASMSTTNGAITKLFTTLNGVTTNWLDPSNPSPYGHAIGFYSLFSYTNTSGITGKSVPGVNNPGTYVDMWVDKPTTPGGDPLDVELHWVIRAGDPGIYVYQVVRHGANDGPTDLGAATINFFPSASATARADGTTLFYSKDTGVNNMGVQLDPFPSTTFSGQLVAANPGRQVQAETVDYTATTLGDHIAQPGLVRGFISKYNYGTYVQFHVAHGFVGDQNAFWWVLPSTESQNGGPNKQVLSTIQLEYQSAHLGGTNIFWKQGQVLNHIYGPFHMHFNAFDATRKTADDLYAEAASTIPASLAFFDTDSALTAAGYLTQAQRGSLQATVTSPVLNAQQNKNVVVLSDNHTYFHESAQGYQYWNYADPATGKVTIPAVNPGAYRLTSYILGQWGLFHQDDVVIGGVAPTTLAVNFQPRNFSTQPPVWTIGIPDRSAGEFLHGHDPATGRDIKDYYDYNYWADLAANKGKVVYTVGTSNYATDWPFTQYNHYAPGFYAGIYPAGNYPAGPLPAGATTGKNGYDYLAPSYTGLPVASYGGGSWEVHFKTTAAQIAQGGYVLISINLAGNDHSSIQVNLNSAHSNSLLWYPRLGSDPEVRSGVSGYNNYAVFQFPVTDLKPAGTDNIMTLFASGSTMYDALKLEIGPRPAEPALSGWPEYDWLYYDATGARQSVPAAAP